MRNLKIIRDRHDNFVCSDKGTNEEIGRSVTLQGAIEVCAQRLAFEAYIGEAEIEFINRVYRDFYDVRIPHPDRNLWKKV